MVESCCYVVSELVKCCSRRVFRFEAVFVVDRRYVIGDVGEDDFFSKIGAGLYAVGRPVQKRNEEDGQIGTNQSLPLERGALFIQSLCHAVHHLLRRFCSLYNCFLLCMFCCVNARWPYFFQVQQGLMYATLSVFIRSFLCL